MSRLLPLLDLSRLDAPGADGVAFLKDLRSASRDVGFFYLVGHGITEEETDNLFSEARRFFALPEADKAALAIVNSPHFRGYTREGGELTAGAADWREQIDFGNEREILPQRQGQPAWTRLQGPNLWPERQPSLRQAIVSWQEKLSAVAIKLLEAFALSLDQPRDAFAQIYGDQPTHRMKLVRYPGQDSAEGGQGVGAHKDSGFLTLLLQDQNRGLQVEYDGRWIDAEPVPGSFVVNIGELLELASNGYLKATVHRVVSPPPGVERYSVPFFFSARYDAEIPLLALPAELAAEAGGPTSDPANPLFRNVGSNVLKTRLRSHPDVARRHYADIVDVAAA